MPGRWYEDYEPGQVFRHEPSRTVTETDNLMFCALSMNPQPLHLDAEFAKTTEHGRQVVNGLFTVALAAGLTVFDTTLGTTAGNLAYTEMTHTRARSSSATRSARRRRSSRSASRRAGPTPASSSSSIAATTRTTCS